MANKRYFSEEEVTKWNEILSKRYFRYGMSIDSSKKIRFFDRNDPSNDIYANSGGYYNDPKSIYDKVITPQEYSTFSYDFSFSVIKKRKDEFFKIVDSFIVHGFEIGYDIKKSLDLKEEAYKHTQINHTVYNNEMVRVVYNFNNPLSAMLVSTIIEDAISFFGMMWGYTEKGEEQCLIKYPIGSIVSKSSLKNVDYMVNNYEFVRPNCIVTHVSTKPYHSHVVITKPTILYDIVCIENDIKSPIIRYGDSCIISEGDICASRTNNLNIILN